MSNYNEQIAYDFEKGEFYISRKKSGSEEEEKLSMSTWNFVKTITVFALLVRTVENLDINVGTSRTVYYQQPIQYTIDEKNGKEWFLRLETFVNPDDRFKRKIARVFLKNADTGQCNECPLPNALFDFASMPFLSVEKLPSKRIKTEDLEQLFKSGLCLGFFNLEMLNKLT